MQDEQMTLEKNNGHLVSSTSRTKRIIDHLGEQWQYPHAPSADTLQRITEFVINLPEQQQKMALTTIAEYLVTAMELHFLEIMATFQQNVEQEGRSTKEHEEYLSYILTELFPKIMGLSRTLSVQSLDDLAALSNITMSLYTLSHADSAEAAQNWIYELPKIYPGELALENLICNIQTQECASTLRTQLAPSSSNSEIKKENAAHP